MATEYKNGNDILLKIKEKFIGSCSSHEIEYKSETKDIAVKPAGTLPIKKGTWKDKAVTGLSVTISAEGLMNDEDGGKEETSYDQLLNFWELQTPLDVCCMRRGTSEAYMEGVFVISSIKEAHSAGDDSKYNITLESVGDITVTLNLSSLASANPIPANENV